MLSKVSKESKMRLQQHFLEDLPTFPIYLQDFDVSNFNNSVVSTKLDVPFLNYNSLSKFFKNTILLISSAEKPRNYEEVFQYPPWICAMKKQLKALQDNGTWSLTTLPTGKSAIGCRWVYKIKHHTNGSIERYKARLIAKGYNQIEGLDFLDTFAPIAKLTTLRLLLALAATQNWTLKQLDVNNVFLHGDLDEEVYMQLPQGFHTSSPNLVCRLKKSLYGLKQAGRKWYAKLSNFLLSHNYKIFTADHSLFLKHDGKHIMTLLVYVDDIILTGNNTMEIFAITSLLYNLFHIKNLGDLTYFLGIKVARNVIGIHLSQRKYVLDLLKDTGMLGCAPTPTLMLHNVKLSTKKGTPLGDAESTAYRRLIGRLIYLTNTRPDISFFVNHLIQFVSHPTSEHHQAAMRILHYLKRTPSKGIFLHSQSLIQLKAYSDSDWATCPETHKSITSFSGGVSNLLEIQETTDHM